MPITNIIALNDRMIEAGTQAFEQGFNMVQRLRANTLNIAQKKMAMEQSAQTFPLELQGLQNKNAESTMRLQFEQKHLADSAIDQQTMHNVLMRVGTDPVALLSESPPEFKTAEGMAMWTKQQAAAASSLQGMAKVQSVINELKSTDPLIQARIAAEQARKASYDRRATATGGPIEKEEILPGIWAVRLPNGGLHIVNDKGQKDITESQRLNLKARLIQLRQGLSVYGKDDPERIAQLKNIQDIETALDSGGSPGPSPKTANPPPLKKRYKYDPVTGEIE